MDEEYVQEHILTGDIVGPVGGASPTHSWPLTAISLSVAASYPVAVVVLILKVAVAHSDATRSTISRRSAALSAATVGTVHLWRNNTNL